MKEKLIALGGYLLASVASVAALVAISELQVADGPACVGEEGGVR